MESIIEFIRPRSNYERWVIYGNELPKSKLCVEYVELLKSREEKDKSKDTEDYTTNFAIKTLKEDADSGDSRAQSLISLAFLIRNFPGDSENFSKYIKMASDNKEPKALGIVGMNFLLGKDKLVVENDLFPIPNISNRIIHFITVLNRDLYHRMNQEKKFTDGIKLLEKAISLGNYEIAYLLGGMKLYGIGGIIQDYEHGIKLLTLASDHKYPLATFELGIANKYGIGVPVDLEKSVEFFLRSRNWNIFFGDIDIAEAFLNGNGVPKNIELSKLFFEIDGKVGNSEVLYKLGMIHLSDEDEDENMTYALDKFLKANIAGGHSEAKKEASHIISKIYEGEIKFTPSLYNLLIYAEKVEIPEMYKLLGFCDRRGVFSEKNHARAIQFYEKAREIDPNDTVISLFLGEAYFGGFGTTIDKVKAASYFREAHEKGNLDAWMYLTHPALLGDSSNKKVHFISPNWSRSGSNYDQFRANIPSEFFKIDLLR
jgi:TPR repeat protein